MHPVLNTAELRRIRALPTRILDLDRSRTLCDDLTSELTTPEGRARGHRLWPIQAVALYEAATIRGLLGIIPVGGGKTLLTWLLPTVTGCRRPLLLIPASLRDKTVAAFQELAQFWKGPEAGYRIESYTQLTLAKSVDLLDRYAPDIIICDEAHKLRNPDGSVHKRIRRYVDVTRAAGKEVVVCLLTGTLLRKSLSDLALPAKMALGDGSPLPRTWVDLQAWEGAVDENSLPSEKKSVGALLQLVSNYDNDLSQVENVRHAIRDRIRNTPGVIIHDQYSCETDIHLNTLPVQIPKELDSVLQELRTKQELPDGHMISDPLSMYRLFGELSLGLYYRWDPRPPESWLLPRREWCAFVRDYIKSRTHSSRPIDTEAQVVADVPGHPTLASWRAVENTFQPNTVAEWITDQILAQVVQWLETQPPTLVWVGVKAAGDLLSRMSGIEYYHSGGLTTSGRSILRASPKRHAICSVDALREGYNLQAWSHNLLLTIPSSAERLEQLIGRTHRAGQARDVYVTVLQSIPEQKGFLDSAIKESEYVSDTQGVRYKILEAKS